MWRDASHIRLHLHAVYRPLPQVGKKGGDSFMDAVNLNTATFVGIDCHPTEHTALAINRFEDEKGKLRFENTKGGIRQFLSWLPTVDADGDNIIVGLEGEGNSRRGLIFNLLKLYPNIYEVNPLYTKQRRTFGTNPDKSDPRDAKLIAEVLTRKLSELPKITENTLSSALVSLKKLVWMYEETTERGTATQNQLHQLKRELELSEIVVEKKTLAFVIKDHVAELKQIKRKQEKYREQLALLLKEQGSNLTTIPGISTVLAAKIVAHSGGIERFENLNKFINYSGIAPKEKSSGKTKKHKKTFSGNRKLNHTFFLAAMIQIQRNEAAKAYYQKKISEGKTKKHALRCVMKRIACIVYGMLKSGEEYKR